MKKGIAFILAIVIFAFSSTMVFATDSTTTSNENISTEDTARKIGDVDGDGEVTIKDATFIQRSLAKYTTSDEDVFEYADVDKNGKVDIRDVTCIQKIISKSSAESTTTTSTTVKPTTVPTTTTAPTTTTKPTTIPTTTTVPPTTTPIGYGEPTAFELEIFNILNKHRVEAGVEPLKFGKFYYNAAKKRAEEIDTYFSHERPDGTMCSTVFEEFGVDADRKIVGENIAQFFNNATVVMDGFMASPGHKYNILYEEFEYVAIATYPSKKYPGYYSIVQLFYSPKPNYTY